MRIIQNKTRIPNTMLGMYLCLSAKREISFRDIQVCNWALLFEWFSCDINEWHKWHEWYTWNLVITWQRDEISFFVKLKCAIERCCSSWFSCDINECRVGLWRSLDTVAHSIVTKTRTPTLEHHVPMQFHESAALATFGVSVPVLFERKCLSGSHVISMRH